jgi:signal transduction histidine kinase
VANLTPSETLSPPWLARIAARFGDRGVPDAIDYAIAAACFAVFTVPVLLGAGSPAHGPGAAAAFGAMAAAPLAVRRRWPIAVVAVVTAVYVAATLAGVAFTPFVSNAGPDLAIAVFTAADRSPRRWSAAAAAGAAVLTWAALPAGIHLHPRQDQDAVQLIAVVAAWVAGDMMRALRVYRQQLDFEKRRRLAEEQERARAEERLRLSRDVHDVISHSLSAIAVQAGMARLVLAQQPAEAGAALSAIETTSRSALDELRKLLRQIRDPHADDEAATPTLSDLPALVGKLRAGGLDLSYHATGQHQPYGTALELSAYRIAQEALTNITRHAYGARARVEVDHGRSGLTITVTNDAAPQARPSGRPGPPAQPAGSGLGITGMRERAALLGGELTTGTSPDGGFTVVARLPAQDRRR